MNLLPKTSIPCPLHSGEQRVHFRLARPPRLPRMIACNDVLARGLHSVGQELTTWLSASRAGNFRAWIKKGVVLVSCSSTATRLTILPSLQSVDSRCFTHELG